MSRVARDAGKVETSHPPPGAGSTAAPPRRPEESAADRRLRRAAFLRELAEARELRRRVAPRRSKQARIRAEIRRRTFRV